MLDRKLRAREPVRLGTSNPAEGMIGHGGVARNVAENLARLGADVSFASCIGADEPGRALVAHLAALGVDTADVRVIADARTAEYTAILEPDGSLCVAMADMGILDAHYDSLLDIALDRAERVDWLFADCNAPASTLSTLVASARSRGIPLALDAISTAKARRLPADLSGVRCLFLNRDEALAVLGPDEGGPDLLAAALLARGCGSVVLTLGADGAIVANAAAITHVAAEIVSVVDVTGAGDAMIAGTLFALARGQAMADAARFGTLLAARTVVSPLSVDASVDADWAQSHLGNTAARTVLPS